MAKKTARKVKDADFNLSQAIRDALTENSKLTAKETLEAIHKKHPAQKINEKTLAVSWSKIRREEMGVKGRKRTATPKAAARVLPPKSATNGVIAQIRAAHALIAAAGGASQAKAVIDAVVGEKVPF